MWSQGGSINDHGESILLLEPRSIKPNKAKHSASPTDPTSSFLGGTATFFPKDANFSKLSQPLCAKCGELMHLVLQMYAPLDEINLDRTMYVFACNKASCIYAAFSESSEERRGFCVGGGGVIRCLRSQCKNDKARKVENLNSDPKTSNWVDDSGWGEDGDDWDAKNDDESMDQIEAMLAKLETEEQSSANKVKLKKTTMKIVLDEASHKSFSKYDLDLYDEPIVKRSSNIDDSDSDDENDDFDVKNDSIQKLLTKYISEEEDQAILSAIQGGPGNHVTSQGGEDGEKYERLPPEDRAFLLFSHRVKLAPKQSVRYAFDGIPLWSRPAPLTAKGKRGGQSRDMNFPVIPPCTCGSRRTFEFQLMPSVLHVLDVDKYWKSNSDQQSHISYDLEQVMKKDSGGMNWGCIAVFSCVESCERSYEEFVIVQESPDGTPQRRQTVPVTDMDDENE